MHVEYAETYEEVDGLRVRRYEDERGENDWGWCPPTILAWMPCDIPAIDLPAIENLTRQKQMADDPVRLADADYVLRWVHQQGADKVPPKIHDLAARALDWPSLAHGFADDQGEQANAEGE